MSSLLSPGVQVIEDDSGPQATPGVSTSVGGLLGLAPKGPVNQPVLISSMVQFVSIFGGPTVASRLYEQVQGFFQNGGQSVYVCRAAHYTDPSDPTTLTAQPSKITLQTAVGGSTRASVTSTTPSPYNLSPGDLLQLAIDGGSTTLTTFTASAAQVTGSAGNFTALQNLTVNFIIDNDGTTQTVVFDSSVIDLTTAIAAFNAQARECRALNVGGQFSLAADLQGSASAVSLTGGTALAPLGLVVGSTTGSGNVQNIHAVSLAEVAAAVAASTPQVIVSPTSGPGTFTLTSRTSGAASDVQIQGGPAAMKLGLVAGHNHGSDSAAPVDTLDVLASSPGAFGDTYAASVVPKNTVVGALAAPLSPGPLVSALLTTTNLLAIGDFVTLSGSGGGLRVQITAINGPSIGFASQTLGGSGIAAAGSQVVRERFDLSIDAQGKALARFSDLAPSPLQQKDYFVSRVNNLAGTPVFVADHAPAVSDARPAAQSGVLLTGGNDGGVVNDADLVGSQAGKTGVYAFDQATGLNMLSAPGMTSKAVQAALLAYVTTRADMMALIPAPLGLTAAQVQTYFQQTLNAPTSYAAQYAPWVQILSPVTGLVDVTPPDGFLQGMYARCDKNRNVGKAPAGEADGKLLGTLGVDQSFSRADCDLLYPAQINPILSIPGAGICAYGSRTAEAGGVPQISQRRTLVYIKLVIAQLVRRELFENNDPTTRGNVTRLAKSFLRTLRTGKILVGDKDADAFQFICDATNNTPSTIAQGQLNATCAVATQTPGEFIHITVSQSTQALDAELAS